MIVASGIAEACERDKYDCGNMPLPTGHEQMEQDRAQIVLPHNPQLAGRSIRIL